MFTNESRNIATDILESGQRKGLKIAIAESCTGGLISALLTDIPGSSDVFERGYVTYSNASKTEMLGVDPLLIKNLGAVSEEVAIAMARGALERAGADVAVAVTGIAGPSGGSAEKPVGTVYIVAVTRKNEMLSTNHFKGTRGDIRMHSVAKAMQMLRDIINHSAFADAA